MTLIPGALNLIDKRLQSAGHTVPPSAIRAVYEGTPEKTTASAEMKIAIVQAIRIEFPHWEDPRC